jgi:hypothetical protein
MGLCVTTENSMTFLYWYRQHNAAAAQPKNWIADDINWTNYTSRFHTSALRTALGHVVASKQAYSQLFNVRI